MRIQPDTTQFLEVLVHDLRNPLNVLGLTLRVIEEVSRPGGELAEDLAMLRENVAEIDRMLALVADYIHLPDDPARLGVEPFDPRRLLEEVLADFRSRRAGQEVRLEDLGGPERVELDPWRARIAVQRVLGNAAAAAGGRPIRVVLGGGPPRCTLAIRIDVPPVESVQSTALRPDSFVRLAGTVAERRGLDLALAARVSELFGGTARLDVEAGRGTAVILDWPARMPKAGSGERNGA